MSSTKSSEPETRPQDKPSSTSPSAARTAVLLLMGYAVAQAAVFFYLYAKHHQPGTITAALILLALCGLVSLGLAKHKVWAWWVAVSLGSLRAGATALGLFLSLISAISGAALDGASVVSAVLTLLFLIPLVLRLLTAQK